MMFQYGGVLLAAEQALRSYFIKLPLYKRDWLA